MMNAAEARKADEGVSIRFVHSPLRNHMEISKSQLESGILERKEGSRQCSKSLHIAGI